MDRWWSDGTERGGTLWGGVLAIVVIGAVLGIAQNVLVRMGDPKDGLAWRYTPPPPLPTLDSVTQSAPPADGAASAQTSIVEAFGIPSMEIPESSTPIQVTVKNVRELVDANNAALIDAREPHEYAEGHIPGAINMPFDAVITDTERLEAFDPQGKPIIVYCGGAGCELSMKLGYALVAAGKRKVLVYEGGMPEWTLMGYPVAKGATGEGA